MLQSFCRANLLPACLLLLASLLQSGPGQAQGVGNEQPIQPRLITQFGHRAPVDGVVWLNGERNLVSLDQAGLVLVWDVATETIVNRARLPVDWSREGLLGCVRLEGFEVADDAAAISVVYRIDRPDVSEPKTCPGLDDYAGSRFAYLIDPRSLEPLCAPEALPTGELLPNSGGDQPACLPAWQPASDLGPAEGNKLFPQSPDGTWQPLATGEYSGPPGAYGQPYAYRSVAFWDDVGCNARVVECSYWSNTPWGVLLIAPDRAGELGAGEPLGPGCSLADICLTSHFAGAARDVDISTDGERLAILPEDYRDPELSGLTLFSMVTGRWVDPCTQYSDELEWGPRQQDRVQWVGERAVLIVEDEHLARLRGTDAADLVEYELAPDELSADFCETQSFTTALYVDEDSNDLVVNGNGNFLVYERSEADIGLDRLISSSRQGLTAHVAQQLLHGIESEAEPVNAGYIEDADMFWIAFGNDEIQFRDGDSGALLLTMHSIWNNMFISVMPDGRYDTNLIPDNRLMRWLVPDEPWRSLDAQTFMRDYFEPGLYRKLLECRVQGNCDDAFEPLPAIASLNRTLPQVSVRNIAPRADISGAIVSVEVTEGFDPSAANGKTRSGISGMQILLSGRVVGFTPAEEQRLAAALDAWRAGSEEDRGVFTYDFTIPVPMEMGLPVLEVSAYAFNDERIKSATATAYFEALFQVFSTEKRAYVINIGIDDYDNDRFDLDYAVNDAELLAGSLTNFADYDVRQLTLPGGRSADGSRVQVDSEAILGVLQLVMTDDGREANLRTLRERGIDAAVLEQATPDDIVIISYSGHGWADARGDFFLLLSDARWDDGAAAPDLDTVVSSRQLADILRAIKAQEIVLILDACHSAASVETSGFKPGPMGDSGLGQLAYDKGILILAATQADDVALEKDDLQQGLLSFALAEGLTLAEKQRMFLSDALQYAVDRVPTLIRDVNEGKYREILWAEDEPATPPDRSQRPAFFNFDNGGRVEISAAEQ